MNEYKVDYSTDALADLETIYFNILLTSLNHVMANDVIQAIKDKVDSLYSFLLDFKYLMNLHGKKKESGLLFAGITIFCIWLMKKKEL